MYQLFDLTKDPYGAVNHGIDSQRPPPCDVQRPLLPCLSPAMRVPCAFARVWQLPPLSSYPRVALPSPRSPPRARAAPAELHNVYNETVPD